MNELSLNVKGPFSGFALRHNKHKIMNTLSKLTLGVGLVLGLLAPCAQAQRQGPLKSISTTGVNSKPPNPLDLPPLEPVELKFSDFFVSPIGARGLELTKKLRALDGKRVRILGYMVQQEQPVPGRFLLSPLPVKLNEEHYGLAEDLPPTTVFAVLPANRDKLVPFTPRMMLLTGQLSVGNREEPDGRISAVRLNLEPSQSAPMKRFPSSPKAAARMVTSTKGM